MLCFDKMLSYCRETCATLCISWSTVLRIEQTDRVSASGALSATDTFYFRYLHSFVHASLHCAQLSRKEHAMPCVSSTDFHTTNLVDVNWTVTVINQLRLPLVLLMTLRIPP